MPSKTEQQETNAEETLAYIRETIETASGFTHISGGGLVGVGILGLFATASIYFQSREVADLSVWLPTAILAVGISNAATAKKVRKLKIPLWNGSFRKLAWVMIPALIAGAMLTMALREAQVPALIPGTWLALYGAAVTAGGTQSARDFRWMGICFLILGAISFVRPEFNLFLLGVGFSGLHLAFGFRVSRKYGG